MQPTPESHEAGMVLSVGDARWTLVSIHGDHDPSRARPVMVTLDVTNLSGRAAPMVVVPVAKDDQGSPYVAQHETDASNPVAPQPRLADAALAPGQTRRVRFLFLLPRQRTVSELVLPGLAPAHGARRAPRRCAELPSKASARKAANSNFCAGSAEPIRSASTWRPTTPRSPPRPAWSDWLGGFAARRSTPNSNGTSVASRAAPAWSIPWPRRCAC